MACTLGMLIHDKLTKHSLNGRFDGVSVSQKLNFFNIKQ